MTNSNHFKQSEKKWGMVVRNVKQKMMVMAWIWKGCWYDGERTMFIVFNDAFVRAKLQDSILTMYQDTTKECCRRTIGAHSGVIMQG